MAIEHPMKMLQRAHRLAQSGDLRSAAELYRAVLLNAPSHANALAMLGIIERELGHFDEAEVFLHKAAALEPNAPNCSSITATFCSGGRNILKR